MEIVPGIHMVDGSIGCNTYLIVEDGITLVDTGLRGNLSRIYHNLHRIGHTPRDVRQIVITHAHLDHINCLHQLKRDTGATVMAGVLDADIIEGKKPLRIGKGLVSALLAPMQVYYRYTPVKVDVRLKDDDPVPRAFGLKAVFLPGHSEGNTGLYSREKKTFFSSDSIRVSGDRLVAPHPRFTSDMEAAMASIKKIGDLDIDVMLPGHGPAVTGNASARVRELYREIRQ